MSKTILSPEDQCSHASEQKNAIDAIHKVVVIQRFEFDVKMKKQIVVCVIGCLELVLDLNLCLREVVGLHSLQLGRVLNILSSSASVSVETLKISNEFKTIKFCAEEKISQSFFSVINPKMSGTIIAAIGRQPTDRQITGQISD